VGCWVRYPAQHAVCGIEIVVDSEVVADAFEVSDQLFFVDCDEWRIVDLGRERAGFPLCGHQVVARATQIIDQGSQSPLILAIASTDGVVTDARRPVPNDGVLESGPHERVRLVLIALSQPRTASLMCGKRRVLCERPRAHSDNRRVP
jgi:hypothetical protein